MGTILRSAALIIALICCYLTGYSQGSTSRGTEFWTAFMANSNPPGSDSGSVMDLYITSDANTTGSVTIIDGSYTQNFSVTANQITVITIPASAFINQQGTSNKGIHILSAKPIAVYAHIFANSSSGATLLLPVNTLGKDYYSINYTQKSNQLNTYSAFMIIATEDHTSVEITPATALLDGTQANVPFTITLNKGQVYQGLANNDLTGTRIRSISTGTGTCTKIAVFSGSTRMEIGCNSNDISSDNLFQQVYPTASWGKNYITVPLKSRTYDIFRIVLSDPTSSVQLNGQTIPATSCINGLYYEFNSSTPQIIASDKPIQVVQYAVSQGNTVTCGDQPDDVGDPEMIYLTPLEQTINDVTLFSARNFDILSSFINVIIKTSAIPTFILDGTHYTSFSPIPNNVTYSYAQIAVATGTHSISAGDGFNAIAYGFGVHESYGYAAGTNLQDLNSFIALQPPATNTLQNNGCTGIPYNLVLILPYAPSSITWDLKDGSTPTTISNPVPQLLQKDGQTLYQYKCPKSPINHIAGSYTALATAFNQNADACGSTEQYELDYNISDAPTAKIALGVGCLGDLTQFTDQSTISVPIKSWLWDFGDGQTSVLQNPQHLYNAPGNYTASLTVLDIDSCTSIAIQPIHIYKKPVAAFTASTPDCVGQNIAFLDQSTTAEGVIVKWIWDFGDGEMDTLNTKTPTINHTYSNVGVYAVKLTVVSDNGCASPVFSQPETINPVPIVDFSLPDVCLNDTFAQFNDQSTIADYTETDFTYLWNFGDPKASPANPNTSTQKNPKHSYQDAANYNVTLSVQSKYGCPVSKTQVFTVNGANPVANFTIENNNSCSSDAVIFDDKSYVDFGNITRVVWYFDYVNHPMDSVVYTKDTMPADRKYSHSYGIFNTGTSQNYEVKMMASSGSVQSCSSEKDLTVTQTVNPTATLAQISPICQGANPVQIIADNNGFTGNGVFTGPGVSSTGLFNPTIAGPGMATINYTITSQNSCTYTTSEQITVIADPTVSADTAVGILEGNQVVLKATASGNNLSYKWTPSIGLDHDDILNPVASPIDDTQYTLTVTSADNCTAQVNVMVKVLKKIIIPNTFTPNGDGINDTWMIKYLDEYPGCTVDIFNRNGQKVYTSISYNEPWDGKYKGNYLPTGTYYYIINPKHGRTTVSGSVTIIK